MEDQREILRVEDLKIRFDGETEFEAVRGLSFSIREQETLAIVGESGSGKSLTALALMGLLPKTAKFSGEISLVHSGQNVRLDQLNHLSEWATIRGKSIGMIFQEPMSSLNPVMKIGRQLTEAIQRHQAIGYPEARVAALSWLERVRLSNSLEIFSRYPHQLSGGQKQRVMIAMALCNHPVLLIADEPTTALDVTVQQEVVELMKELQRETGTAMIFITHDLALASEISDEVLVMFRGEMIERGTAKKVLHQPDAPYTRALIACKPTPEKKGRQLPVVADFLAARGAAVNLPLQPKVNVSKEDALLSVKDLRVWYTTSGGLLNREGAVYKAVDGVSFDLHRGEVLGLVGESGCGKSTLSRSLIGLVPVSEGQVGYEGMDLTKLSRKGWREYRRNIQMIFQDPFSSLNPRMTVGDIISEPLSIHKVVPRNEIRKEVEKLLDLVHLPKDAYRRYPHQFSGGQRQRVGIARALAPRPQILICDESVSALDVSVQAQILNLLKELQTEFSLSYLFISHDLSVVHYISDSVLVMQSGKIVEAGEARQVLEAPQHPYTTRLIESMPRMK